MQEQEISKATYELQFLDITGNVIPQQWFTTIRTGNNTPDYIAIIILAEIVYWYKPTQDFDERGLMVGLRKKYKGDKLQKSYDDLSLKFGITKRQARDAVVRLEEAGVIQREFRNIVIGGVCLSNVLFIDLNVEKLKELTIVKSISEGGVTKPSTGECSVSSEVVRNQGGTYTKSTTKTTTKITQKEINVDDKSPTAPAAKKGKRMYEENEEPLILAKYLHELIKRNNEYAKEPNFQAWANDIRLMHESDGLDYNVIKNCISWCQQDSFWYKNILSAKKLREKFPTLYLQAKDKKGGKPNGRDENGHGEIAGANAEFYDKLRNFNS